MRIRPLSLMAGGRTLSPMLGTLRRRAGATGEHERATDDDHATPWAELIVKDS